MSEAGSWYQELNIVQHKRELVLVYIGAASCGPCRDPKFKAALARFKLVVAELSQAEHCTIRSMGVSTDWDLESGLRFLNDCGPWDEVVVGNNWYNSAVIEHIWSVPGAEAAVPQVLLVERFFEASGNRIEPGPKNYLVRLGGTSDLHKWLDRVESPTSESS